jgi:hypothetical protein
VTTAVLLLVSATILAQPPVCRGKNNFPYDVAQNRTPKPRAVAEIRKAYALLCPLVMKDGKCGRGEIFENPSVGNNALTFVSGLRQGRKTRALIVYSARFLNLLDQEFGAGASFGVLAHEVGHHLTASGHLRREFDHPWDEELRADYFAGCALAGAGRSFKDLEVAFKALAKVASPTHPASGDRNPKVKAGYQDCLKYREAADRKAKKPGIFGLGAVLESQAGKRVCWRYTYRRMQDVKRVGPVAAKRQWSPAFAREDVCERSRLRNLEQAKEISESCACLAPE